MVKDKTEREFWRTELKDGLKALGHCCRIESHATSIGLPDVNLKMKVNQNDWWIEVKVSDLPGAYVEVRPAQWMWHTRRRIVGGRAMFITRWHRPYGLVYTVNTQGPLNEDRFDRWCADADLVMHDRIDWERLIGVLKNAQV